MPTVSCKTGSAARRRYRGQVLCQRVEPAQVRKLLSGEHFSVDGTLIEAWASMKRLFVPKDGGDPPSEKVMVALGATPSATSTAEEAQERHGISRPPTLTPACSARVPARRPNSATWASGYGEPHGLIVDARLTEANRQQQSARPRST